MTDIQRKKLLPSPAPAQPFVFPARVRCLNFLAGVWLILFILIPGFSLTRASSLMAGQSPALSGKISISGAWALYPLAVRWAEEFQKENPGVKIDLQAGGAGKGMADVLAGLVDIGLVSRNIYPEELARGALPLAVARDAVVGTLNQNNPFLQTILQKGLTREKLRAIYVEGKIKYWEELLGLNGQTPIRVYTRSDACGAAETWAAFLGAHQEDLQGIAIYGDPGLAEAVRRDPYGLGFNNLNFAYSPDTLKPHQGLAIVPLDLNQDGQISPEESFYQDRDRLTAGISAGLYPSPPARDLYLVIKKTMRSRTTLAFLDWVLVEGQRLVEAAGYLRLDASTVERERQKLKELNLKEESK
ncbi:MAG: extracellular solute-binding protein [Candidatus Saccharicenans sp.]|jgi:phosphate transport system substrate-binding protein|nr:extracellular solute-binding protein [Candidatus Saccharicenans sp.]MDH7493609.1 extracellular solute-binding protein [Candidatus Saccharicenans sp.]